MKSDQIKFIISIVVVVAVVIGLGFFLNKPAGPSKYDSFAKALASEGAQFYGAFWCPHCQAEKALFGSAKQYLPYIECSNPDRSQTQICKDAKIESYPTWYFKNGITLTASGEPTVCKKAPGDPSEQPVCKQLASQYGKTWIFPGVGFSIRSATDPVKTGTTWKFDSHASATGEIPLAFLASQIAYTLPQ